MAIEATLDDTVILSAYTEGYLTPHQVKPIDCPYEIGTREFDLWLMGQTHRRMLAIDVRKKVA